MIKRPRRPSTFCRLVLWWHLLGLVESLPMFCHPKLPKSDSKVKPFINRFLIFSMVNSFDKISWKSLRNSTLVSQITISLLLYSLFDLIFWKVDLTEGIDVTTTPMWFQSYFSSLFPDRSSCSRYCVGQLRAKSNRCLRNDQNQGWKNSRLYVFYIRSRNQNCWKPRFVGIEHMLRSSIPLLLHIHNMSHILWIQFCKSYANCICIACV